jgi:hypothetical protein
MSDDTMLTAHLLAEAQGGASDLVTLRALVEEAAEMGARRALARLGLADEAARDDVTELRTLLRAWRDAKSSAWKAAVGWAARGALALLLIGLAVKLGLGGMIVK